ncbi:hypothetical protein HED60_09485 [Planctomycetales bacterium ZRK34]|nr:hypothetical protein HED60_09485 [Planctomycetales bacterium ZRK34]
MSIRRSLVLMIMLVLAATLLAGDDANNPHDLKTLAAKQAWISLQRDLEKLDAQYQRDRQARIRKAIVDLETAKVMAAQAVNADEIVRIDQVVNSLREQGPVGQADSEIKPVFLLKIQAVVDGVDELHISTGGAQWVKGQNKWPPKVQLNDIEWNPKEQNRLSNDGNNTYLSKSADIGRVMVIQRSGRGPVEVISAGNVVRIAL